MDLIPPGAMVGVSLSNSFNLEIVVTFGMDGLLGWQTETVDQFSYSIVKSALWGWCVNSAYRGYQNPKAITNKTSGIDSLPTWWFFI